MSGRESGAAGRQSRGDTDAVLAVCWAAADAPPRGRLQGRGAGPRVAIGAARASAVQAEAGG